MVSNTNYELTAKLATGGKTKLKWLQGKMINRD